MPHDAPPRDPRPRIYLAGPDVFFRGSEAVFQRLMAACAQRGLVGVPPSDGGLSDGFVGSDELLAQRIYEGNVERIRSADGVIANLVSFRGHEPDSGTAFEVGFAVALGKPVVAYNVPGQTYAERVAASIACERDAAGVLRERASGTMVEGLGQRLNLMLTRSAAIAGSAEEALALLAHRLHARTPAA